MCHGAVGWQESEGWSWLECVSPEAVEEAEIKVRAIAMLTGPLGLLTAMAAQSVLRMKRQRWGRFIFWCGMSFWD